MNDLARISHTFRVNRQRTLIDTGRAPIPAVGGIYIPSGAGIERNAVAVEVRKDSPEGYEKSGLEANDEYRESNRVDCSHPNCRTHRRVCLLMLALLSSIGIANAEPKRPNLGVAAGGSGVFKTVQESIDPVVASESTRTVIFIKPGTYKGMLRVPPQKKNLKLVAESSESTIHTYDDHAKYLGLMRRRPRSSRAIGIQSSENYHPRNLTL